MTKRAEIGGTKIRVFEQETEPVLLKDEIALWRNTAEDKVYFIMRDSLSDTIIKIDPSNTMDFQESVKKYQSAPPASPTTGDRYLVKATGTGLWAGHDDCIATWNGKDWKFDKPDLGFYVWVEYEESAYVYTGSPASWVLISSSTGTSVVESKIESAVSRSDSGLTALSSAISGVADTADSKAESVASAAESRDDSLAVQLSTADSSAVSSVTDGYSALVSEIASIADSKSDSLTTRVSVAESRIDSAHP